MTRTACGLSCAALRLAGTKTTTGVLVATCQTAEPTAGEAGSR